jgi:phospholipase C
MAMLVLQCAASTAARGASGAGTATPIKHVVIVMMENHSFDNVFGMYPTLDKSSPSALLSSIQAPDDVLGAPGQSQLHQVPNGTFWTVNPAESVYYNDWNNGKMDGFAANSGSQSMTFFGPSQFAAEWDLAEQYAIGDRYFSSCLCETDPNRVFSLAGYAAGQTQDGGPPPYVPVNQSIIGELEHFNVSWGYYVQDPANNDFPLNYFDGIDAYSAGIQPWGAFNESLREGTLPAVSWVMPTGGGATGVDQHPSYDVTVGESWLLGVTRAVMKSPYWNSTAIFVTYDEGGGYYDHVPPPELDGVQLGFRVPFIVISPYAKEDYVSHTSMNHASTLAFVDFNWRLPALNSFVAESGMPLDMFDFNQTYTGGSLLRPPVDLRVDSRFPQTPQIPFGELPYAREGSSAATLASLGPARYVETNTPVTPFFQSVWFTAALGGGLIVAMAFAAKFAKKRARTKPVAGGAGAAPAGSKTEDGRPYRLDEAGVAPC